MNFHIIFDWVLTKENYFQMSFNVKKNKIVNFLLLLETLGLQKIPKCSNLDLSAFQINIKRQTLFAIFNVK